jgi:NitT/TauT family transport system substrate-binding protein
VIALRAVIVALALVAGAQALGCGGGDGPEDGPTDLTVQLVPIHEVAPVYLGVEKGFFEQEDLDVEIITSQGGAEGVPQVLNGDVQVGYASTPSLFAAAVRGLPIEIVAPAGGSPRKKQGRPEADEGAVIVPRDGPIRSYADLAGKTVGVNSLGSVLDVTLNAALEANGIDHTRVEYLEVAFPDMHAALDAGRVDAAFIGPPFQTIAEQSGDYRSIGIPFRDVRPDLVFTSYFVSRQWAEENEDTLERFQAALRKSMLYAAEHERETRATIGTYTKLPKELLPVIPVGNRRPDCKELAVSSELLGRLMVEYGALDREPDLRELIRPGFCDGLAE